MNVSSPHPFPPSLPHDDSLRDLRLRLRGVMRSIDEALFSHRQQQHRRASCSPRARGDISNALPAVTVAELRAEQRRHDLRLQREETERMLAHLRRAREARAASAPSRAPPTAPDNRPNATAPALSPNSSDGGLSVNGSPAPDGTALGESFLDVSGERLHVSPSRPPLDAPRGATCAAASLSSSSASSSSLMRSRGGGDEAARAAKPNGGCRPAARRLIAPRDSPKAGRRARSGTPSDVSAASHAMCGADGVIVDVLPGETRSVPAQLRLAGEMRLLVERVERRGTGPTRRVREVHHFPLRGALILCPFGVLGDDQTGATTSSSSFMHRSRLGGSGAGRGAVGAHGASPSQANRCALRCGREARRLLRRFRCRIFAKPHGCPYRVFLISPNHPSASREQTELTPQSASLVALEFRRRSDWCAFLVAVLPFTCGRALWLLAAQLLQSARRLGESAGEHLFRGGRPSRLAFQPDPSPETRVMRAPSQPSRVPTRGPHVVGGVARSAMPWQSGRSASAQPMRRFMVYRGRGGWVPGPMERSTRFGVRSLSAKPAPQHYW